MSDSLLPQDVIIRSKPGRYLASPNDPMKYAFEYYADLRTMRTTTPCRPWKPDTKTAVRSRVLPVAIAPARCYCDVEELPSSARKRFAISRESDPHRSPGNGKR